MFSNSSGGNGDFEALARQYWSAWGDAMRQGGLGAAAAPQPAPPWQSAVDWWSQLMPGGPSQANDAVGRFKRQASDWFGQMQQVAAQFAGQDSSANEVGQAWRRALGATANNPLLDMLKGMRGPGAHGMDEWLAQVKPYLDGLQQQTQRWQQMPAFGQYREHQERWQALQLAQQEYQQQNTAYNQLLARCLQRAFEIFEDKLVAHEEPGRQIATARALFDLWIDAAEQAYAEFALSQEFRELFGALTNAQMRLRAAIQLEVEHITGLFGMPSRTEVDSAHRKIAELERALRRSAAAQAKAAPREARAAPVRPQQAAQTATQAPAVAAVEAAGQATRPVVHRRARKATGSTSATTAGKAAPRKPARKPARQAPRPRKAAKAPTPVVRKAGTSKLAVKPAAAKTTAVSKRAKPIKKIKAKPVTVAVSKKSAKLPSHDKSIAKPAKSATTKAAVKKSVARVALPLQRSAQVVSMKDWVARYAAANAAEKEGKQKGAGKKGARK